MRRQDRLEHRYVEYIPKDIEEGILYISTRFSTASHLCCCGCGFKVATPLNPSKWHLVDHGASVSLSPSVGLGALPCRSHYWISRGRVDWYPEMTAGETLRAQRRDELASKIYTGEVIIPPPSQPVSGWTAFWRKIGAWLRSLIR